AMALNNLAELYRAQGKYTQAEPLYQQALEIDEADLGSIHPSVARDLNNLALIYQDQGQYAKAELLALRALEIYEHTLGTDHPLFAKVLNNLATQYITQEKYADAKNLILLAFKIQEKKLGARHPDVGYTINNFALLHYTQGKYSQAEHLYQRVIAIFEAALGANHPNVATSLNNLAHLHWAQDQPIISLSLLKRAQSINETQTTTRLLTGSEASKHAWMHLGLANMFANISFSLSLASNPDAARLGYASLLHAKGRVLDSLTDSVDKLRRSVNPEDRQILEDYTTVVQQQATLFHQGPGQLSSDAYHARLTELAAKKEQLETTLAARSAVFKEEITPVTLEKVQAALPENAALIDYVMYLPFDPKAKKETTKFGEPRYAAYVLKPTGDPIVIDLGDTESIQGLIQDFRAGLRDPDHLFVNDDAKKLSIRLLHPLHPHLQQVTHFLLSPDGALNLIPFGALLDEQGTYLAANPKLTLTYLTSGRDLVRFGVTPAIRNNPVIVADPDFGQSVTIAAKSSSSTTTDGAVDLDRGGMVFKPLRGTAEEATALQPLLRVNDDHLLTQAHATEARVKQVQSPRILHIATHGFFLQDQELPAPRVLPLSLGSTPAPLPLNENPLLRSGLALAGANVRESGKQDDGILTAAEVAQLDLGGTELVVLSACETGVGQVQNGEGVYGLRRALVLAGAQAQVSSLWKVADAATKDLMVEYYQRLIKGEGRSAALREAQRTMMANPKRSHPYYWASFIPIGNWRPLAAGATDEG
ncbi:MAG: CHAT domain-containing protein, partial [Nitrospira sp.]|nr:CHAT domain-containing protein [Nitrospira sp.]